MLKIIRRLTVLALTSSGIISATTLAAHAGITTNHCEGQFHD